MPQATGSSDPTSKPAAEGDGEGQGSPLHRNSYSGSRRKAFVSCVSEVSTHSLFRTNVPYRRSDPTNRRYNSGLRRPSEYRYARRGKRQISSGVRRMNPRRLRKNLFTRHLRRRGQRTRVRRRHGSPLCTTYGGHRTQYHPRHQGDHYHIYHLLYIGDHRLYERNTKVCRRNARSITSEYRTTRGRYLRTTISNAVRGNVQGVCQLRRGPRNSMAANLFGGDYRRTTVSYM